MKTYQTGEDSSAETTICSLLLSGDIISYKVLIIWVISKVKEKSYSLS